MNDMTTRDLALAEPRSLQVAAGPLANAIAAMQAGMTIESLRGMMELQRDYEANEARKDYVAAMTAFKLDAPIITKDKSVNFPGTSYNHATLGNVVACVVGTLAEHGFSHSWETTQKDGIIKVTCKLTHRSGHSETFSLESAADISGKKNAIQAIASAQTYLQRYTLLAATGLATSDQVDDDGRGYEDVNPRTGEITPVRAVYTEPAKTVNTQSGNFYPQAEFDANLKDWTALIQSGRKTAASMSEFLQKKNAPPLSKQQFNVLQSFEPKANYA